MAREVFPVDMIDVADAESHGEKDWVTMHMRPDTMHIVVEEERDRKKLGKGNDVPVAS